MFMSSGWQGVGRESIGEGEGWIQVDYANSVGSGWKVLLSLEGPLCALTLSVRAHRMHSCSERRYPERKAMSSFDFGDTIYCNSLAAESDTAGFYLEGEASISFSNGRMRMENLRDPAEGQRSPFRLTSCRSSPGAMTASATGLNWEAGRLDCGRWRHW